MLTDELPQLPGGFLLTVSQGRSDVAQRCFTLLMQQVDDLDAGRLDAQSLAFVEQGTEHLAADVAQRGVEAVIQLLSSGSLHWVLLGCGAGPAV